MTEVYVGQIIMTGFGFAPRGFALCNGQTLPISQNQALFSLLGVQYGGNGVSTFLLPNLQGRTPAGAGASGDPAWQPSPYPVGESSGTETVPLLPTNLPIHTHAFAASTSPGTTKLPGVGIDIFAQAGSTTLEQIYGPSTGTLVPLNPTALAPAGGGTAHANMQPFRVISFSIAMNGVFPSRN